MLGNSYERSAAGDYDPESPRPNGVTGTLGPSSVVPGGAPGEGGSQFGSASRGMFGPPPLPSVNPPTHSAFAPTAGRFVPSAPPGLPGAVGSAVPLWPPSKIPTLGGKPPRTFSGHSQQSQASVSRTTSLQSDYGGPRLSSDDLGAVKAKDFSPGIQVPVPEQYSHQHGHMNTGGEQMSHAIDNKRSEDDGRAVMQGQFSSHDNQVYGWQQQGGPEHSQMPSFGQDANFPGSQVQDKKKPPPAIAKESPLKALYAKGGEKHLEGRRKISLNASLDAAALQPEEKPGYMPPVTQNVYAPESTATDLGANTGDISESAKASSSVFHHNFGTIAPPPASEPAEKTSHSFNHEPPGFQSFQHSAPQTTEASSAAEGTRGSFPSEVPSRHKGSRNERGFWPGRRTFLACFLLCLCVALNPYSAMNHITVAGIGVHAWISGFLLSPMERYYGMKAEYDKLTSAHIEWSTMIDSIYTYSYEASTSSWDIVERKIICDTNKHVCRLGRAIVQAPIAASLFSKSVLTGMARNAPQLWKMAYHTAQSSISSSKYFLISIQRKGFKTFLSTIAGDSRKLMIGSKDFALCAMLKGPRGIHTLGVFDNILRCWISSFESFLGDKAPFETDYADRGIDGLIKEEENKEFEDFASINDIFNETEYIETAPDPTDNQEDASGKVEDRELGDDDSYSEYYPQYPEMDQFETNDSTTQPPRPQDTHNSFENETRDDFHNSTGFSSDVLDNSGIADTEIPSHEDDGEEPSSPDLPIEPEQAISDDEDIILKRLKIQEEILSATSDAPADANDFDDDKIGPRETNDSVQMADTLDVGPTSEPPVEDDDSHIEASAQQLKDGDDKEIGSHGASTEEDAIKKSLLSPRTDDESSSIEQEVHKQAEEKEYSSEPLPAESLEQERHQQQPPEEMDTVDQTSQLVHMQNQLLLKLTRASDAIKYYTLKSLDEADEYLDLLKRTVSIDAGHLMTAVIGAITAVVVVWLKDRSSRRQQGASRMAILTTPTAVIHARKSRTDNDMNVPGETGGDQLPVKESSASQSRRPARRSIQPKDTTSQDDPTHVSPRPRGRRASATRSASTSRSRSKSATATGRTRRRAASKANDAS